MGQLQCRFLHRVNDGGRQLVLCLQCDCCMACRVVKYVDQMTVGKGLEVEVFLIPGGSQMPCD